MTIRIRPGKAFINGYYYHNTANLDADLGISDGVSSKIARVVLRWDFAAREINAAIKHGALSSSPIPPVLQRDADVFEIALADILINKGALQISQQSITDLRFNEDLCGVVTGVIDQIDPAVLTEQFENYFETFKIETAADVETWLTTIQDLLDSNAAANLANEIFEIKENMPAGPSSLPYTLIASEWQGDVYTIQEGWVGGIEEMEAYPSRSGAMTGPEEAAWDAARIWSAHKGQKAGELKLRASGGAPGIDLPILLKTNIFKIKD